MPVSRSTLVRLLASLAILGLGAACADPEEGSNPTTIPTGYALDPTGDTGEPTGGTSTEPDPTARTSGDSFTVDVQLASDVDASAPTTVGIVTWAYEGGAAVDEAYIRFGLDTDYGTAAPVDPDEPGLRTLLLGMKPASTYHFQIVATVGGQQFLSDDYTLETGAPYSGATITLTRQSGSEPGFLVITDRAGGGGSGGSGVTVIVDPDGDIVWWYDSGTRNANVGRMSADGKSMWFTGATGNGGSGLRRVSMDTLQPQIYSIDATHDVIALEDDCMAFNLDVSGGQQVHRICSGETTSTVISDLPAQGGTGNHLNSVRYNVAGNLLTVSDHQTDLYGVDRSTGDVLWSLSDIAGSLAPHHGQHFLGGSLLLFANNGGSGNNSAVFEIDLTDGSVIWSYDTGIRVGNLGDVQRLPGGNTLVVLSSQSGTDAIRELTPSGEVVMTLRGIRSGYGFWRSSLYGLPPAR